MQCGENMKVLVDAYAPKAQMSIISTYANDAKRRTPIFSLSFLKFFFKTTPSSGGQLLGMRYNLSYGES